MNKLQEAAIKRREETEKAQKEARIARIIERQREADKKRDRFVAALNGDCGAKAALSLLGIKPESARIDAGFNVFLCATTDVGDDEMLVLIYHVQDIAYPDCIRVCCSSVNHLWQKDRGICRIRDLYDVLLELTDDLLQYLEEKRNAE